MTEQDERTYEDCFRTAWIQMLGECLKQLGVTAPETQHVAWIAERGLAVSALRELCAEHGDNNWPDNLALSDVIEKHLRRHLSD